MYKPKSRVSVTSSAVSAELVTRFWEIDTWRGWAIVTMIIYHLMYDLQAFGGVQVELDRGVWFYLQRFTAISFITLAGVSAVLSYDRALTTAANWRVVVWTIVRRGLHILGMGMILSVVMRVAGLPPIDFGVLHLIGTSIILSVPFLRSRRLTLVSITVFYTVSYTLKISGVQSSSGVHWLIPLGIEPPGYYYSDYFPFVHWFPVFLIGVSLGSFLYKGGKRKLSLPNYEAIFPFSLFRILGNHALVIYLVHQPILIGLLLLAGAISFHV